MRSSVLLGKCYENKIISRGDNFPSVNMVKESLDLICVLLHQRLPLNEIGEILSLTEFELQKRVERLCQEGLVKKVGKQFLPTFLIVTQEEGEALYRLCSEPGGEIANLISEYEDKIMEATYKIAALKSFSFQDLSLFIISDVLLDCIQIDNVENQFLKAERPNRNNKHYYYSIMEKPNDRTEEAFGIFGNWCKYFGDMAFCVYGKERYNSLNFLTLTEDQTIEFFGPEYIDKGILLDKIVKYSQGEIKLEAIIHKGFEALKIIQNDQLTVPILNSEDYDSLYKIAGVIKDGLINILSSYRHFLYDAFSKTLYNDETTFEEYFIWYYHFLYSYVTEELIRKGLIHKKEQQMFSYVLV